MSRCLLTADHSGDAKLMFPMKGVMASVAYLNQILFGFSLFFFKAILIKVRQIYRKIYL